MGQMYEIVNSPPWLAIVFLVALGLYFTVGLTGSVMHTRGINYDDQPWKDKDYDPTNDDRFWFLGFYNNPNDYELFVPARRMWGRWALNVGRPLGLAWIVLVILMIVAMIAVFLFL